MSGRYLDCGCYIGEDLTRTWCPTCSSESMRTLVRGRDERTVERRPGAMYYDGVSGAREAVQRMKLAELLDLLDALFGRDALHYGATVEDVRAEALRQVDRDWTMPEVRA